MPRFPLTIWLTRLGGTPIARAKPLMLTPQACRSSSRISPGWIGGSFFLVIIDDFDSGRPFLFPPAANSVLIVDPDAVLAVPVSAQRFEAIAAEYPQIAQRTTGALFYDAAS